MKIIIVNSVDSAALWTEEDWPAVPRTNETVVMPGGKELMVLDVDHDFAKREIRVWVRVPLIELR